MMVESIANAALDRGVPLVDPRAARLTAPCDARPLPGCRVSAVTVRWNAKPDAARAPRSSPRSRAGTTRPTPRATRSGGSPRSVGARVFATLDTEEYLDFQAARPTVELVDGVIREIQWPALAFSAGSTSPGGRDLVLLLGVEPNLRWPTFCDDVISVARATGCEMVVTLGALLGDVPHTRPMRCTGSATDEALAARLGMERSRYEGPTGIVGVLHDSARRVGLRVGVDLGAGAALRRDRARTRRPRARCCCGSSSLLDVELRAHRPRDRGARRGSGRSTRWWPATPTRPRTWSGSSTATTRTPMRRRRRRGHDERRHRRRRGRLARRGRPPVGRVARRGLRALPPRAGRRVTVAPTRQFQTRSRARPSQRRVDSTSDSMSTRSSLPWNMFA